MSDESRREVSRSLAECRFEPSESDEEAAAGRLPILTMGSFRASPRNEIESSRGMRDEGRGAGAEDLRLETGGPAEGSRARFSILTLGSFGAAGPRGTRNRGLVDGREEDATTPATAGKV